MFSQFFWRSTAERAVKSFAQSLLALLTAGQMNLLEVPWDVTLATAGMAALLSVLTSIGSSRIGDPDDPSAVSTREPEPVTAPAAA